MAKRKIVIEAPKWSVRGLALSVGLVWAISVLILSLTSKFLNYGLAFTGPLQSVYVGYELSLIGIVVGVAWAFLDGFIGGAIVAWVYNLFR
ncbi:bacteriophage holin [Candidatus Woesearchaeota archaeon]|nr:bacteriophage holin [Candidatus Woesearchaeota archaeon]